MTRLEELTENLAMVRESIVGSDVTLIVVTKTYPAADVAALKTLGINDFGENRDEEASVKASLISARWHFQGEIQSKKLRSICSWASVIHSIDSASHIEKLGRILQENQALEKMGLFLQLSLDGDPQRGGVIEADLESLAQKVMEFEQLQLLGIMCVPPVTAESESAFGEIAAVHQRFKARFPDAKYLSAGMSGDFAIAISHGATHIRVGSSILGPRTTR